MRVAAIDIGTNTTRLLVAEVEGDQLEEIERRTVITRLGEGVDVHARLSDAAIARALDVLGDYRSIFDRQGASRVLALATSAVRDAQNGAAFLGEVERRLGFTPRQLSGDEEALLAYRGATLGRVGREGLLVADIGGGSTELVLGGASGPRFHVSCDIGAVRLTERFVHSDPPKAGELARCSATAREAIEKSVPPEIRDEARDAIGCAATVTTLAALDLGLDTYDRKRVHGHQITRQAVEQQLERLASLKLAERRRQPALEPERASVIVAGIVICREILDQFSLDAIEASELDILDGAALLAADEARALQL